MAFSAFVLYRVYTRYMFKYVQEQSNEIKSKVNK